LAEIESELEGILKKHHEISSLLKYYGESTSMINAPYAELLKETRKVISEIKNPVNDQALNKGQAELPML
jgi:hypothetical protein